MDRGSFSVEVILTLFAFKCMSPSGKFPPKTVTLHIFDGHSSCKHLQVYGIGAASNNFESCALYRSYPKILKN